MKLAIVLAALVVMSVSLGVLIAHLVSIGRRAALNRLRTPFVQAMQSAIRDMNADTRFVSIQAERSTDGYGNTHDGQALDFYAAVPPTVTVKGDPREVSHRVRVVPVLNASGQRAGYRVALRHPPSIQPFLFPTNGGWTADEVIVTLAAAFCAAAEGWISRREEIMRSGRRLPLPPPTGFTGAAHP